MIVSPIKQPPPPPTHTQTQTRAVCIYKVINTYNMIIYYIGLTLIVVQLE